jgi:hypothetical protein
MKSLRTIICSAWIAFAFFSAGEVVTFNNINQVIPDNDPAGFQNTQELTGFDNVLTSLVVYVSLSSVSGDLAFNGDYYMSLQHDSGFAVLLNRVGRTALNPFGYGDSGLSLSFTIDAPDIHGYQDGSYALDANGCLTGTWGADGRETDPDSVLEADARTALLDSFSGTNPNGNWTLFVADLAENGVGQVDSWGLNIQAVPEPATGFVLLLGFVLVWGIRVREKICT